MLSEQPKKRTASRRVRALLAGGLVLGVGAAITLAAWNDSEFATGTFTAGSFNMEGSIDGTAFAENPVGDPAALSFSTGFDNLSPSTTVAAPFVLRLDAATTTAATVTVAAATSAQNGLIADATANLTYTVLTVTNVAACTSSATAADSGAASVVSSTAFNPVGAITSTTINLAKSADAGATAGANVYLCMLVTTDADLAQDSSAVATWEFAADSATP
jgi:predicted ribosomally synthesized peptide with SipW-like signal peptide